MAVSESSTDRIYEELKAMAAAYRIKPGERVNESRLSVELGASRTPLREALNRLVAEGLVTFRQGKGFYCRDLDPKEILDLYEARLGVETTIVQLACERASAEDCDRLTSWLRDIAPGQIRASSKMLVSLDERFHMALARLSGNGELERILDNINARIRFVRWIDMDERRPVTHGEHVRIVEAVRAKDKAAAIAVVRSHISRRADEITAAVREGFARLYVP
jgi:DNA-binding GntR family transcriptional regulator